MKALAWRIGAIDEPRERGLHQFPTARLGGLAIWAGIVAAGLVWLPSNQQTHGILAGATVIVAVGIADDLLDLSADVKFAGQVLAAVVPVAAGVRVETMTLPFLGHIELGDASYPLTVLGIVAVMNIVNFIDGVDGLAAGVCTIAAGTFAVIALSLDRNEAGVLAMLTAGAALGYLRHGFHPASIFLGDSGSNLLGYMLAAIAVQGALKTNAVVALVFPLVILAVPILDSSFVIAKRIKYGQPVYRADSWHFHHRFANIGFSQRRTVLYLYGWTLVLAMLALALRFVPYSDDHGNFDVGLEPRDRRILPRRRGGERLSGAGARDPEAEALPPVPDPPPARAAGRATARGGRGGGERCARARDGGVRGRAPAGQMRRVALLISLLALLATAAPAQRL